MPLPITTTTAPYAIPSDETNDDTTTAVDGFVDVTVTIHLTGQVSQVQADWATLAATALSSPSALMAWSAA